MCGVRWHFFIWCSFELKFIITETVEPSNSSYIFLGRAHLSQRSQCGQKKAFMQFISFNKLQCVLKCIRAQAASSRRVKLSLIMHDTHINRKIHRLMHTRVVCVWFWTEMKTFIYWFIFCKAKACFSPPLLMTEIYFSQVHKRITHTGVCMSLHSEMGHDAFHNAMQAQAAFWALQ